MPFPNTQQLSDSKKQYQEPFCSLHSCSKLWLFLPSPNQERFVRRFTAMFIESLKTLQSALLIKYFAKCIYFSEAIRNVAGNDDFWIGLNDIDSEGEFRWLNGDVFRNEIVWGSGQPDNHNSNEDCVHLNRDRNNPEGANDVPCSFNAHGLCEKPILT